MQNSTKKNFTLIELLVVIAIIAILAAMLLPALSAARTSANTSACTNNIKNIALASIMYTNENKDWLLPGKQNGSAYWSGAISARPWFEFLGKYGDYSPSDYGIVMKYKSYMNGHIYCPGESQMDSFAYPTYAINTWVSGDVSAGKKTLNMSQIALPDKTIHFTDQGRTDTYEISYPWDAGNKSYTIDKSECACTLERHGGKTNIGYIDGHARTVVSKSYWGTNGAHKLRCGIPGFEANWDLGD